MKNKTDYQHAKAELKLTSINAKKHFKTDKPAINQIINDSCYFIGKNWNLSEYQCNNLANYSCTLHPKK
jgi:hypothetical protein